MFIRLWTPRDLLFETMRVSDVHRSDVNVLPAQVAYCVGAIDEKQTCCQLETQAGHDLHCLDTTSTCSGELHTNQQLCCRVARQSHRLSLDGYSDQALHGQPPLSGIGYDLRLMSWL